MWELTRDNFYFSDRIGHQAAVSPLYGWAVTLVSRKITLGLGDPHPRRASVERRSS